MEYINFVQHSTDGTKLHTHHLFCMNAVLTTIAITRLQLSIDIIQYCNYPQTVPKVTLIKS